MYDILIVGAGTAGISCAIHAAQAGAKVGVIDKASEIGGALHWSGGHMSAGGTRRQKAMGIDDSPEKHLQDIYRINGKSGDLALTELAVREAPKTIDWLDDLGFEFAPECPRIIYGHVPYTLPRTHYGTNKAISILDVFKPLWDAQVSKGHIDFFPEHALLSLEQENDRYQGLVAQTASGQKTFHAQKIVLTTGGYGSNPNYFSGKHPNVPLVSSAHPDATADGHLLLEKEDGRFRFADMHVASLGGVELEPGRCNFNEAWAMVLTSIYRQPREIYVNANGKRFMREDEEDADLRERIVMQQPGWKFWLIFDEEALLERSEEGTENPIMIGWDTAKIKAAAKEERFIWQADTIQELCNKTNLPYADLQQSIEDFNGKVDKGLDEEFGRKYLQNKLTKGPYYALLVHASVLVTFGGMQTNDKLQLLNTNGEVMQGLYAAGELLGLGATSGNTFCSGMAITPAISFGRILGGRLGKGAD